MVNDIDESLSDDNLSDEQESVMQGDVGVSANSDLKGKSIAQQQADEQAQKNIEARKRIDELMEKKRLKELLDDSEDW